MDEESEKQETNPISEENKWGQNAAVSGNGGGASASFKPGGKPKWLVPLIIAIVLLIAGGVAAWMMLGDKDSKEGEKTASGKTKLTYMVHWLEDPQITGIKDASGKVISKGLQQYLDEYEDNNSNIEFALQQVHFNDYADRLRVLADSGAAPDIYQIYAPWGAEYVRAGILAEPPARIVSDIEDNYVSTAGPTIEGKIWGIPTEVNNYALLYNKDLFKQAGIVDGQGNAKEPKTWQDVLDAAKKLTKKDSKGVITQYGVAFARDFDWQVVDPYLSLLFSNGGQYLSSDLKKAAFNNEEGVAALDAISQLFKDQSTDAEGNFFDFKDSKVGIVVSPPWAKSTFATGFGNDFEAKVGVAPMPSLKEAGTLGYTWFTGVTKDSKNQDEAWKFLEWFTSETQASGTTRYGDLLANTIGAIPARKVDFEKHEDVLGDFFTKVYVDQMKNATVEPNVLQSSTIKAKLMTEIQAVWDGDKTSKEALDNAAKEINKILELYY